MSEWRDCTIDTGNDEQIYLNTKRFFKPGQFFSGLAIGLTIGFLMGVI